MKKTRNSKSDVFVRSKRESRSWLRSGRVITRVVRRSLASYRSYLLLIGLYSACRVTLYVRAYKRAFYARDTHTGVRVPSVYVRRASRMSFSSTSLACSHIFDLNRLPCPLHCVAAIWNRQPATNQSAGVRPSIGARGERGRDTHG